MNCGGVGQDTSFQEDWAWARHGFALSSALWTLVNPPPPSAWPTEGQARAPGAPAEDATSPYSPQSMSSLEVLAKYGVCCVPERDPGLTGAFQVQDTHEQSMRLKHESETLRK